jgi:hypoxanthine phosphoribosyltransferase
MCSFLDSRQDLRGSEASEWKMLMTDEEIYRRVQLCADHINKNFVGKNIILTCVLKGAAMFFVDLAKRITIPNTWYFISASSYHDSQTQSDQVLIEKFDVEPKKFVNKHVILIDELFDSGHTLNDLKIAINSQAKVPLDNIYTVVLFKKTKEVSSNPPDFYGVAVPDVWLVGYGLDDAQEKRGWTYLFACPKAEGIAKTPDDKLFIENDFYETWRKTFA